MEFKSILKEFLRNFRLDAKRPLLTILLPIFLGLIIRIIAWRFGLGFDLPEFSFFGRLNSAIIKSITEEFVWRGIIFGFIFLSLPKIISKKIKDKDFYLFAIIGLVFQSIVFFLYHNPRRIYHLVSGFLFGAVYLLYNRNLLPSILVHVISNTFSHVVDLMLY